MKIPGGLSALQRTFVLPNYRLYVIGNLSSNLGLWVQRVAIGWLTWELTNSTAWLGGIAIAESAPTIAFGLIAGTVVDRVDYFKMMRITQACSLLYAVAMAAFTFAGWMNIWLLLTLTIARGSIIAFHRPSRMTVVYSLVGRDLLPSALAMNSMIFNTARFVGPAIGGAIIVAGGAAWTFAVGAVLFFVFTLSLRAMDVPAVPPVAPERREVSMLSDTVEGLRYILSHPGIRTQLSLLVVTSIFAKPVTDLLPGFAAQVFERGPVGLAFLLSFHGIGAMAGGLWLASRGKGLSGMTAMSIRNILLISIGLLLFSATDVFWIACPLIAWIGYTFIVQGVSNQTLIQSAVDPALRGRVISIYGLVAQGVPAIGSLIMGGVAEHVGLRPPIAVGALICLALWVWAWRERKPLAAILEADPAHTAVSAEASAAQPDGRR
jgi:predicted MFS family arabinose efflux permease